MPSDHDVESRTHEAPRADQVRARELRRARGLCRARELLQMLLGGVMIVGGLAAAAWGVSTALRVPRPASLGAAVVAAIGLAVAMLGLTKLLVPSFF